MADINQESQELAELLAEQNRQYKELGFVLPQTRQKLLDAQTGIKNFGDKATTAAKTLQALGAAATAYAGEMYRGEQGAAAFNKSLDHVAEAAEAASYGLALLMPGGFIMKGVALGLTYLGNKALQAGKDYAKAANNMSDAQYKLYQGLSESGASASDGMQGLFESTQKMGMGMQDFAKVVGMLNENAEDLAVFGRTVYEGRQRFGDLAQGMKQFQVQMFNAGMTQEQINQGTVNYIRLQTRLGRSQTMTNEELVQGTRKFLIQQDALTKLTGQNAAKQQEIVERALTDEMYAAQIRELQIKGDANSLKAIEDLNTALKIAAAVSPEMEAAFKASITGNLRSADAQKLNMSAQGVQLQEFAELIRGTGDPIKSMQRIFTQVGKTADGAQLQLAKLGASQDIYLPMATGVKAATMSANDMAKAAERIGKEQTEQGIKDKAAADASIQAQSELRASQQRTMLAEQAFVNEGVKPATTAMQKLAMAAEKAAMLLPGYRPGGTGGAGAATTSSVSPQQTAALVGTEGDIYTGGAMSAEAAGQTSAAKPQPAKAPVAQAAPAAIKPPPIATGTMPGYERPGAAQAGSLAQIREMIASVESKGNYNIVVGGKEYPLTDMTIQEVLNLQKQLIGQKKNSAAGKYQVKYTTLAESVGKMGLKYDQKFDAGVQDQIADFLIMRRGYTQYARSATAEAKSRFLHNLSQEWAGLPQGPDGQSYYKGVGDNKAHIGWNQALAKFGDGGIVNRSQMARVGEKGPEAIIPLKNGSVPVTISRTGLLGLMPTVEIDNDTTERFGKGAGKEIGTEIKIAISELSNSIKTAMQPATGADTELLSVMQELVRGQKIMVQNTARMLQVAAN